MVLTNEFRKSTWSTGTNGGCLEAAHRGQVLVRDRKQAYLGDGPQRPVLRFEAEDWNGFLQGLR